MSPVPKNDIPQDLRPVLVEWGVGIADHREIDHATQYYLERGPESVLLNVFSTGRVVVQGKNSGLKDLLAGRIAARENKQRAGAKGARSGSRPALDGTPRVGVDEAGKGDYFGPLVVAGVRITGMEAAEKLQELGVRDSKTLGDYAVRAMAERVLEAVGPQNVRVVALSPREYEDRRSVAGNVNRLLDEIDAEIIGELKSGVELIVVDQYATSARERLRPFVPEGVRLEVRQKAEDDAAVATASILARARYLEEMERLSERVGFELPRGSTHVLEAALRVVEELGEEGLAEVAKIHFSITRQVLGAKEEPHGGGSS
ncbi:MAG: ribonuclease HIII [Actinobacteria bacterium]|nr:ribonuclease HIII [Actinomycetota bacterium]